MHRCHPMRLQWVSQITETLLENEALQYLSISAIRSASSINSLMTIKILANWALNNLAL